MEQQTFVNMALQSWNTQIERTNKTIDGLSDEALHTEIAPGKNRISYLLGHLVAVNDGMISLFGLGKRSYEHLDEAFVKNADKVVAAVPSAAELRSAWKKSNEELTAHFKNMTPADWFGKHTAMTDEDLAKDPGRNKLSVLLNRAAHVGYHLGQMKLVK